MTEICKNKSARYPLLKLVDTVQPQPKGNIRHAHDKHFYYYAGINQHNVINKLFAYPAVKYPR